MLSIVRKSVLSKTIEKRIWGGDAYLLHASIVLLSILFIIMFFTIQVCWRENETKVTEQLDFDVVIFPFSLNSSYGLDISSFTLENGKLIPVTKNVGLGYSSVVDHDVLVPLMNHFSVTTFSELQELLGQYFSYRNYNGLEVCVFYDWYKEPYTLNLLLLSNGEIKHVIESFDEPELIPIAITCNGPSLYILLRDGYVFKIREINTLDCTIQKNEFDISTFSSNYYYYVDFFVEDTTVFLLMNEYVMPDVAEKMNMESGYTGGYLFKYNMQTHQTGFCKLSEERIDFMCRDTHDYTWGSINAGMLCLGRNTIEGSEEQQLFSVQLSSDASYITNSALYQNGIVYFHVAEVEDDYLGQHGYFVAVDLSNCSISEIFDYQFNGGVNVKYYQSESEYRYEVPRSTSN